MIAVRSCGWYSFARSAKYSFVVTKASQRRKTAPVRLTFANQSFQTASSC